MLYERSSLIADIFYQQPLVIWGERRVFQHPQAITLIDCQALDGHPNALRAECSSVWMSNRLLILVISRRACTLGLTWTSFMSPPACLTLQKHRVSSPRPLLSTKSRPSRLIRNFL